MFIDLNKSTPNLPETGIRIHETGQFYFNTKYPPLSFTFVVLAWVCCQICTDQSWRFCLRQALVHYVTDCKVTISPPEDRDRELHTRLAHLLSITLYTVWPPPGTIRQPCDKKRTLEMIFKTMPSSFPFYICACSHSLVSHFQNFPAS